MRFNKLILSIFVLALFAALVWALPSFTVTSADSDTIYGANDPTITLSANLSNPGYNVTADFSSVEGLAPVLYSTNSNASATWDINKTYSGNASILLNLSVIDSGTDARGIWNVSGLKLKDASSVSYAFYVDSSANGTINDCWFEELYRINCTDVVPTEGYAAPYLGFELDTDSDSVADTWVIEHKFAVNKTADSWYLRNLNNDTYFHTSGTGANPSWNTTTPIDLKSIKDDATLGNADILKIKLYFGGWDPGQISLGTPIRTYVDNLEINGDLRPEPYVLGVDNGDGTYNLSYTIDTQVAEGGYNISLLAIDPSDQSTAENEFTVSIDNTIPSLSAATIAGSYSGYFSPANLDGNFDTVNITLNASEEIDNWVSLSIYNSTSQTPENKVRQYNPSADQAISLIQTWNGKNTGGDYVPDGDYTVKVKMRDYAGNENETDTGLTISIDNTAPTVDAGTDKVTNTEVSQNATASDTTTGIATYTWTNLSGPGMITFGTPSAEDTTISADIDGNYTIRLTVTDNVSNSAYDDMVLTWDTTPAVVVAGADQTVKETDLVNFNASNSTDATSGIASYSWDFDASDGTAGVNATGVNASTVYNANETYVVTLTVTDNSGNSDSDNLTVTVLDLGPTAVFSYTPLAPDEDQSITFTDNSTTPVDTITNWTWNFGDNSITSTLRNPTHTYTLNGTYAVTLTVADADSSVNSTSQDIAVAFVNDAPVFSGPIPNHATDEDTPFTINLTDYFIDDDSTFTFTPTSLNENITLSVSGNVLTVNLAGNWSDQGAAFITGFADGTPKTSNVFNITVTAVNDVPQWSTIPALNLTEDDPTNTSIDLSAFAADVETESSALLNYTVVSYDAAQVVCEINPNNVTLNVTPAANWNGIGTCIVNADDNNNESSTNQTVTINVASVQDGPEINSTAIKTATQDLLYQYDVDASDGDLVTGETLAFSLITKPSGMVIASSTGLISWIPLNEHVGNNSVTVKVTDSTGRLNEQSFTITVSGINDQPGQATLTAPADNSLVIDNSTTLKWNAASDPDNDQINYKVYLSNDSASIPLYNTTSNTQLTITGLQDNSIYYWYVVANDSEFDSSPTGTFRFNTSFHNDPTIGSFTPNASSVTVAEGASQAFTLSASDLDNDVPFTYAWVLDGVTQLETSSLFTYSPSFDDEDTHTIIGTVTDASNASVSNSWTVVVSGTNRAPVLNTIPALTAKEDEEFIFEVSAVDPDGNLVTFTTNLANVSFTSVRDGNSTTGTATWTPTNDDVGNKTINITAKDSSLQASQLVTITVNNTNDAPTITGFSPSDATPKLAADKSTSFSINASDIDAADTLSITWSGGAQSGTGNTFTYNGNNNPGTFNITATVADGTVSLTKGWLLTVSNVPVSSVLGGTITQLTQSQLSAATNISIAEPVSGSTVDFGDNVLDLTGLVDLDEVILINSTVVAIDSSKAPQLNKPAKIAMKGLGLTSKPVIFYSTGFGVSGNTVCPASICSNIQYSSGTLTFDVTGFSTFFVSGNLAPIANAGSDKIVQTKNVVSLDGSASKDPDNNPLTYSWTQLQGPNVTITNPTLAVASFTTPQDAVYIFQIVVNDGIVASTPDNVTIESLGGVLDITSVKLDSVDRDDKLKPGEELEVKVDIKNRGTIDIESIELKVWFEDSSGNKFEDDDDDEVEDDSEFDLDAGDDEDDLDDDDVTFTFEMPFDVDDKNKYTVVVQAIGDQFNDSSIKYKDIDKSETIEFEKETHEVEIFRASVEPGIVSCRRTITLDAGIRNIGEKEEDVKLTIRNTDLEISYSEDFSLDNDASDSDNVERRSLLFSIKDDVLAGFYPVLITAEYNDGKDTASKSVNVQVDDCVSKKTVEQKEPVTVVTQAPAVTAPSAPKKAVTEVSFKETPEYVLVLGLGVVILTGLVIFAFGALVTGFRKP